MRTGAGSTLPYGVGLGRDVRQNISSIKSVDHFQFTVVYKITALDFQRSSFNRFHQARCLGCRSRFKAWGIREYRAVQGV